jgi:hypothetical protein
MATQAQMERLIGKALLDEQFRALLLEDPEKAARRMRYRLDGGQAARIRSLDPKSLEEVADSFNQVLAQPHHSLGFW